MHSKYGEEYLLKRLTKFKSGSLLPPTFELTHYFTINGSEISKSVEPA